MITCDKSTTDAIHFTQQLSQGIFYSGLTGFIIQNIFPEEKPLFEEVSKFFIVTGGMATITAFALELICKDEKGNFNDKLDPQK